MSRPRLLDLFCGAGGCSVGYHRAGFDVVGVDHKPQPRYPFTPIVGDAMDALRTLNDGWNIGPSVSAGNRYSLYDFDVIHASPPCQRYSRTQRIHGREYPDLLGETRRLLEATGKPWVIENVEEAPMGGVVLCGTMFGLKVLRHRRFESSVAMLAPSCQHPRENRCQTVGRPIREGQFVTVAGNISGVKLAGKAMGIDWMVRRELVQAIPPAYTEWIGTRLLHALKTP